MKNSFIRSKRIYRLRLTLFSLLTVAIVALVFTASSAIYFFNKQYTLSKRYYSLKVMSQEIALQDEILTMSAFAATLDDDKGWKERYDKYEALIANLIDEAIKEDPRISQFFADTAAANQKLIGMEKRAFSLVLAGEQQAALSLLKSEKYQSYKNAFSNGIAKAIEEVLKDTQSSIDNSDEKRGRYLIFSLVLSFLLVVIIGFSLIRYVRLTDRAIEEIAKTDELSGLLNRREFEHALTYELNRSRRENRLLMLAVLDLDNFKKYNDRYGHPKGDEVIRKIGTLLKQLSRRANESAFRLGGEEFGFLATCDNRQAAIEITDNLCKQVLALAIEHKDNLPDKKVTASCGLVFSDYDCRLAPEELYQHADQALYQAKKEGKNRFAVFNAGKSPAPAPAPNIYD